MDKPLITAMGNALALLTGLLQKEGVVDMKHYAGLLAMMGTVEVDDKPEEGAILCAWAGMIQEVADRMDTADLH